MRLQTYWHTYLVAHVYRYMFCLNAYIYMIVCFNVSICIYNYLHIFCTYCMYAWKYINTLYLCLVLGHSHCVHKMNVIHHSILGRWIYIDLHKSIYIYLYEYIHDYKLRKLILLILLLLFQRKVQERLTLNLKIQVKYSLT